MFFLCFGLGQLCLLYKAKADVIPLFVSVGPPAGFETLLEPWTTVVDVYYGSRLLTTASVTVSPGAVAFTSPEEVAVSIPYVKDRVAVENALTGRLADHAAEVCQRHRPLRDDGETCGVIQPDIAGVIFDKQRLRVSVFVAPRFLETEGGIAQKYLSPSSSRQVGFIQTLRGTVSGSSRGNNREVLYGMTGVGYGEVSLESEWDIASGEGGRIASLYAERDYRGQDWRAGYMTTSGFGFSFSPDRPIIGLHASLSENTRTDLDLRRETPLDVYLPVRGRVEVLRDGVLLQSWLLDAGSHQLNTRRFPDGSYNIRVRVLGDDGQVISDEGRFFVSQPALPPLGETLWFAEAGKLVDWRKRQLWPETQDNWLGRIGGSRRLGNSLGGTLTAAGTRNAAIVESGVHYLGERLDVHPSFLVSDHSDYGLRLDSRLDAGWGYLTLGYRKLHPKKDQSPDPVLFGRNSESLYASYITDVLEGLFQYRYSRYSTLSVKGDDRHTMSYQRILLADPRYEVEGRIETSRYGSDKSLLVALLFRLRRDRVLHTVSPRYQKQITDEGTESTAALRYNISYNGSFSEGQSVQAGGWAESRTHTQLAGASARYTHRFGEANGGVDYFREHGQDTTSWVLGAATSFSLSSGVLAVGGQYSGRSMLAVKVDGVEPEAVFQILIDGHVRGFTKGTQITVIPLESFATYQVRVRATDTGIYEYREQERSITLYPGNVSMQTFQASPVRIVYGFLKDKQGQPLTGAIVQAGQARAVTDSQGLYQFETSVEPTSLQIRDTQGVEQTLSIPSVAPSVQSKQSAVDLGIRETVLGDKPIEALEQREDETPVAASRPVQPSQGTPVVPQVPPEPSFVQRLFTCQVSPVNVLICLRYSPQPVDTQWSIHCLRAVCGGTP